MADQAYRDINEAGKAIRNVMMFNLGMIADDIIKKVLTNYKNLTPANRLKAIKDISPKGVRAYKKDLITAMAVIADNAIFNARLEVPMAKKIKLEEKIDSIKFKEDDITVIFDALPAAVKKRLRASSELLVNTQLADLEKAIYFQYASTLDGTESLANMETDLTDKAFAYIDGVSVEAGAGVTGANVVNEARNAFFLDPDVLENIEAFKFMNGDPVSLICKSLAGIIFTAKDPNFFAYTPPLHYNAVLEGSKITTSRGDISIEDIGIGDDVLTHTGKFQRVYETMNKFEDKKYFTLELDSGEVLSLTGEHPVLTINKGWVRMDEISLDDDVAIAQDALNGHFIWQESLINSQSSHQETLHQKIISLLGFKPSFCVPFIARVYLNGQV